MSSSVFFKFKSWKEPKRVSFDGTGISVFELKRDIILKHCGPGDGTDFDLTIFTEDGAEGEFDNYISGSRRPSTDLLAEYDDDTTIIPRSTTVIASRRPAIKPGAGRAARYVTGKMPISAKNSSRREQATKAAAMKSTSNAIAQMNSAQTEEEKMNAMFAAQTESWTAQQEDMSHQTPVFAPGSRKPVNVPDHEPPNGYVCHRCGEKGHWIQQCPTNDNPEFDNRPRVKRTTGIPKSFLKTVDKATILAQAGEDDVNRPSAIMVNADGDFVIAEPDRAAWEKYQAQTKSSAAAQKIAAQGEKELQDRGLECALDNKMFIDPMKTPCCAKTYCNDCITNALIEGDLVCPGCQTEGVLIDDLKPDDDMTAKIEAYLKEKSDAAKEKARSKSPEDAKSPAAAATEESADKQDLATKTEKSKSPSPPTSIKSPNGKSSPKSAQAEATPTTNGAQGNSKKRPAEDVAENPTVKIPTGPKALQKAQEATQQPGNMAGMMNGMNGFPGMPGMPAMNGMPGFPMAMGMGMPPMPMNPMMFPGFNNMNGGFPPMNPGMNAMMNMNGFNMPPFQPQMNGNQGFGMNGGRGGFNPNGGQHMNGGHHMNGGPHMNGGNHMNGGPQMNGYNQGPRVPNFTQPNNADEDAYFRKPVNPHRHLNRQRRVRPSDYREL